MLCLLWLCSTQGLVCWFCCYASAAPCPFCWGEGSRDAAAGKCWVWDSCLAPKLHCLPLGRNQHLLLAQPIPRVQPCQIQAVKGFRISTCSALGAGKPFGTRRLLGAAAAQGQAQDAGQGPGAKPRPQSCSNATRAVVIQILLCGDSSK